MSFAVDLVSEDSFYENLLLGVTKLLSKHPQITDIQLNKFNPCEKLTVNNWEQKNGITLPDDMRKFYLSTDGFSLTWTFKYADKLAPVGHMSIRPLIEINSVSTIPSIPNPTDCPKITEYTKIFVVDSIRAETHIYLVYESLDRDPTFWIFDIECGWIFLCENFTKYFRMLLVYQGLPYWQYCTFNKTLPTWIEEIYLLVAPHLLDPHSRTQLKWPRDSQIPDLPHNHIDPSIFTIESHSLTRRFRRQQ